MKILSLVAQNLKRISVVEIKPSGNMVEISGKNGQGKTTVLDSIWWTLGGTKNIQEQPIRKGAEKATVKLVLGDGQEVKLVVTRNFTAKGSTITVENGDGAKFPSPQAMLDALVGNLTFDPLAFMRMDRDKQFQVLRGMVKLDVDPEALDRQNQHDYDVRTQINRDVKQLDGQLASFSDLPTNLPALPIDTNALVKKIATAGEHNGAIMLQKEAYENNQRKFKEAIGAAGRAAFEMRRKVEDMRIEIQRLEAAAETKEREAQLMTAEMTALQPPTATPVITADLEQELAAAQNINRALERRNQRDTLALQVQEKEKQATELTRKMNERERVKTDAISRAQMPVAGLGFGQNVVTYNGLPLDQASDAEQLRVSCAIAMTANPKLRVLRVRDGSLLDENSMRLLAEMAETADYQIWCEVLKGGPAAIVLEDGHVKE